MQDGGKLDNYLHCRGTVTLDAKTPLQKVSAALQILWQPLGSWTEAQAKLDPALDFLDPLSDDIPKGCWSIQYQKGASCVALRSLVWPGAVFYHAIGTPAYGHVYVGNGLKNNDLIFMLP